MTRPLSPDQWHERAAAVGCRWLDLPITARTRARIVCLTCRYEWLAWPDNVRPGYVCPRCDGREPIRRPLPDGTVEKRCYRCRQWKRLDREFSISRSRVGDGRCPMCKACTRAHYHKTKDCPDRA